MQFDRRLASAEARPGEQGQTKIDRRGVQRIRRGLQFDPEIVVGLKVLSKADEHLGEVGINAPVPTIVGIGQRAFGYP